MTGLSYTFDELTVMVPLLSGFRTTGPCIGKNLSFGPQGKYAKGVSHYRRTVDSWRNLDAETSNDQREPNNLDVRSIRSSGIGPNRNIT